MWRVEVRYIIMCKVNEKNSINFVRGLLIDVFYDLNANMDVLSTQKSGNGLMVVTYFSRNITFVMQSMRMPCMRVMIFQMPHVMRVSIMVIIPAFTLPR